MLTELEYKYFNQVYFQLFTNLFYLLPDSFIHFIVTIKNETLWMIKHRQNVESGNLILDWVIVLWEGNIYNFEVKMYNFYGYFCLFHPKNKYKNL